MWRYTNCICRRLKMNVIRELNDREINMVCGNGKTIDFNMLWKGACFLVGVVSASFTATALFQVDGKWHDCVKYGLITVVSMVGSLCSLSLDSNEKNLLKNKSN